MWNYPPPFRIGTIAYQVASSIIWTYQKPAWISCTNFHQLEVSIIYVYVSISVLVVITVSVYVSISTSTSAFLTSVSHLLRYSART